MDGVCASMCSSCSDSCNNRHLIYPHVRTHKRKRSTTEPALVAAVCVRTDLIFTPSSINHTTTTGGVPHAHCGVR